MLLIKQDYMWFGMKAQVATFVKACTSCNRNKPLNCKPTSLLMPLQIPDAPWSSISVNFITNLPLSNGANAIMVVVDRFTKWAEFFPCSKFITAQGAASIFLKEVFSRHGLPKEIISDQGTQFVLLFFSLLTKALDIKQCLLSAFHPQSNGQTKRINQILEHYLRCYTSDSQDNWADLLPLAMFTYNRRHHSSTKMSPFFANFDYNPSVVNPKMRTPHKDATNLLLKLKATQQVLFDNLKKSVLTYKKFANT